MSLRNRDCVRRGTDAQKRGPWFGDMHQDDFALERLCQMNRRLDYFQSDVGKIDWYEDCLHDMNGPNFVPSNVLCSRDTSKPRHPNSRSRGGRSCSLIGLSERTAENKRMDDLFGASDAEETGVDPGAPLAARMRPRSLDEYLGQQHILGPGKLLRRAIESDRLSSIIFYGPPGSGKTSLAQIIASTTKSHFERLSGVESSVADIRRVAASAKFRRRSNGGRTILFIDEIHRFNKAQQDVLLPDVESGNLRLIGATTHNPFFYVNSPLVSRSQVFQLEPLSREDLVQVMNGALTIQNAALAS